MLVKLLISESDTVLEKIRENKKISLRFPDFFEQVEFTLDLTIFKKIKSGKTKSVKIANVIYDFDFPIFFLPIILEPISRQKNTGKEKEKVSKHKISL